MDEYRVSLRPQGRRHRSRLVSLFGCRETLFEQFLERLVTLADQYDDQLKYSVLPQHSPNIHLSLIRR